MMKRRFSRFISCILALIMLIGMVPAINISAAQINEATTSATQLTVYFNKPDDWANAYIYLMDSALNAYGTIYPGDKMTLVEGKKYSFQLPPDVGAIKFSDGTATSPNKRTENVTDIVDGRCYSVNFDAPTAGKANSWAATWEGAVTPDPVYTTAYFVNTGKWSSVYAYVWGTKGIPAEWPGTLMTKTGKQVNGYDIYSITYNNTYENIIFNGNNSIKTENLIFNADQYYYYKNETWYESVDAIPSLKPAEPTTVYFVNTDKWDEVYAYAWDVEGTTCTWPGVKMTKTGEQVNEYDVYSVTFEKPYDNIIFNDYSNYVQTEDLTLYADKYYYNKDAKWYDALSDIPFAGIPDKDKTYKLYFEDNFSWGDIHAYAFYGEHELLGAWPGTPCKYEGYNIWSIEFNGSPEGVIFNSFNGSKYNQTNDIPFEGGNKIAKLTGETVVSDYGYIIDVAEFEDYDAVELPDECASGVIESLHPYPTDSDETWTVDVPGAEYIYLEFSDDTYVEELYDNIRIYDKYNNLVGKYTKDELAGSTIVVKSSGAKVRLTSDGSYNYYGFYAQYKAYDTVPDSESTPDEPVIPDVPVVPDAGFDGIVESDHPYRLRSTRTWTVVAKGAESIDLKFSDDTFAETNADYIYIYDGDKNLVGKYTGAELASKTIRVNDEFAIIALDTDDYGHYYGFYAQYKANYADDTEHAAPYVADNRYYLRGTLEEWNVGVPMTDLGNGKASVTVELEAGEYDFKFFDNKNDVWYTYEGTINGSCKNLTALKDPVTDDEKPDDAVLIAQDGLYTFTFRNVSGVYYFDVEFSKKPQLKDYVVIFLDYDNKFLGYQVVTEGESAELPEAPTRKGYNFVGWDTDFTNVTENLTIKAVYEKIPTTPTPAPTTGSLKVEVVGGTGFTIAVDGGKARPQGPSYMSSKTSIGAQITVVANSSADAEFLGWQNSVTGAVLSTDAEYTFTASGNDSIKALYATKIDGVQMVTFKNTKSGAYGRVLDSQYYAAEDAIEFPDAPTQVGYDFAGWNMTEAEIQSAIAAGRDVVVEATWTRQIVKVQVTVTNGSGTGEYNALAQVTATANEPEEGQKFAYWTDAEGNIKSYSETYSFFPTQDTEVIAVFVSEDTVIEEQILVSIDAIDTTGEKNVFYYTWNVPAEYDFVKAGIIAVNKDNLSEATFYAGTTDSNVYDRSPSGSNLKPANSWSWSKSNVASGDTWVAKAYVQYRDTDGSIVTVYSDMVEATKD